MAIFSYTAIDEKGKQRFGSLEAKTEEEMVDTLQKEGLTVVSVKRKASAEVVTTIPQKTKGFGRYHRRVKTDDLLLFSQQLSTLIEAGVPLLRSLEIILSQLRSKGLCDALEKVKGDITSGVALNVTLTKHPKIFSRLWVDLIKMGEASGTLPGVLNQLAKYLEARQELNRKIITASIYPIILIFVAIGAITIFVVRIVPIFASLFEGFGVQLPFLTKMVINFSAIMRHSILYIIIGGGMSLYALYKYRQTEAGRLQFDTVLLKLPLVGGLFHELAIQRLTGGLSTLLESGVALLHAIDIVGGACGNRVIEIELGKIRDNVKSGKSVAEEMANSPVFPPTVINMVKVGEESGRLSEMLGKVSKYYEDRVTASVDRLTIAIEPLMLIFMGGIIGTMVVSMFLPIFQLASIARG